MSKYVELLRDRVKAKLTAQGMSQNDLAKALKVASADMSDWLTGKTAIRFERACQIAEALGIQPWELLKPEGAEPTPAPTESRETVFGRVVAKLAAVEDDEFWTISELILHFGRADAADFELSGEITPEQFPRNQKRPK